MPLHLHLSAHSDELLACLRPALAAARSASIRGTRGIPRPVPVLVPSAQLGDWLQVRLARDLGLSMGFEFLQPGQFFARHFTGGPAGRAFAESQTFWAPESLRWKLLPLVDSVAAKLGHESGKTLSARDRFAFAQLLAGQLDRYAHFRPAWPASWSAGRTVAAARRDRKASAPTDDEAWQRDLWHHLARQPGIPPHPAQQLANLASPSDSGDASHAAPVFLVGSDLLDPLLLRSLQVLGARGHEVCLYLVLPSLGYLADQTHRHALQTLIANTPDATDPVEFGGHPLLSSLGQQAVGHFLLLENISPDYAAWPDITATASPPPPGATLLQRLQSDIRAQRTPPGPPSAPDLNDPRPRLADSDLSLRVHSCHSPRRELEVLRDELFRAFDDLPGLKPEDVLVTVTDFDLYAPLAEAILRGGERPLPIRLTSIPAREANPVAVALLALLHLAVGRHSASELIELLNLSAIQHHLDLADQPESLALLAETIRTSGLTHDIDTSTRDHADNTGTWRAALDRHLAGAWFGPVESARDSGGGYVHPLAPDLHQDDETRLRFIAWLTRLAESQAVWLTEASAPHWAARLGSAVDGLLGSTDLDDHCAAVHRTLNELAGVTADTPLDAGALIDWLTPALENATSLRTSMGGEILVGRLNQLHGLPCRVIAFLGLQDGAFPRASRHPSWDLLSHAPERWDSDPRRQDRQWFLDLLLAPTDRLILTAANRSLRTAHDGPLSSCVEEVLRAAASTVLPPDGVPTLQDALLIKHFIQPFSPDYFSSGTSHPRSFDSRAARTATGLYRAAPPPVRPFYTPPPAATPTVAEPLSVTLEQLAAFWKDPARIWLKALGIDNPEEANDDTTLDDSPLSLDHLQNYSANEAALLTRLSPDALDSSGACSRLIADRRLPPGALGALAWTENERTITPLAASLSPLLARVRPTPTTLQLDAATEITGSVKLGPADGADFPTDWVVSFRPGNYDKKPKHQIGAFIQTLAAAAHLGRPVACVLCGLDDTHKLLPAVNPTDARGLLAALIAGYRQGQTMPLCYAPATSAALAASLAKGSSPDEALQSACGEWSKSSFNGIANEASSAAAQLAWRDVPDPFSAPHDAAWLHWATTVAAPLHAWWNV